MLSPFLVSSLKIPYPFPPLPAHLPTHSHFLVLAFPYVFTHITFTGPKASPPIDDWLGHPLLHMQLSNEFLRYIYFIYVSTLSLSSDTEKSSRSHYRWLWATMWLLGIELRTSGRAVSALNCWAISPARLIYFEDNIFKKQDPSRKL